MGQKASEKLGKYPAPLPDFLRNNIITDAIFFNRKKSEEA